MYGYGGEVVIGTVAKDTYNYFIDNEIDLSEFASDWNDEMDIPEEHRFINNGEWHEVDDIAHGSGIEMNEACTIIVLDEHGKEVWQTNLSIGNLDDLGIEVIETESKYVESGYGFFGQSFEKGTFFGAPLELKSPFDPKKLKLSYTDYAGWDVLDNVEYDGEEVYNEDYDTTGKSMEFELIDAS